MIDLAKGEAVDAVSIDGPTRCTPAVVGDVAYVGTEGETFFAINWREAKVLWSIKGPARAGAFRSSAAATSDVLVVGNRGKMVLGLDPKDGKQRWVYNTRSGVDSSPVIVGQRAFCATSRGRLFALTINDGKVAWTYDAGGGFESSPAVASGRLVIGNDAGTLFCFGAKK